jgi:GT2 family glycosyltransferase
MQHVDGEVIVVDNNSIDGSNAMVKKKFPEVKLYENKQNLGFSKANNQGIKKSTGEYVLLLNPDTVVEDDTFSKVIDFMDEHQEAGALGVKMVDGAGKFLPESKRGLPTPEAAFYKMFGISSMFPRSKRFSKYHLGYLDENKIHEVEILSGAFMLLRKKVLDEIGLLDETFFMYGEDIDLSYRVIKAGYKNYYFPKTRIIHYKGESTKKSSVNYVLVFYNAMVIFAKKHFTYKSARLFTHLINLAIYFRAFLAILSRLFERLILTVLDAAALLGGILLITMVWGRSFVYTEGGSYPDIFFVYVIPAYIIIWLLSIYFSGGYDKPVRIIKSVTGMIIGTMIILVLYALLPESFRFSRALILLGAGWGLIALPFIRFVLHLFKIPWIQLGEKQSQRFLVIGEKEEAIRVSNLLQSAYMKPEYIGMVSVSERLLKEKDFVGNINQVNDIVTIYKIDEVIFCSKNIAHQMIIDKMTEWQHLKVDYKIAPEDSLSIIGSNSIHTRGDLYTVNINAVDKTANRRNKRLIDISLSLILLVLSPIVIFSQKHPFGFLKNLIKVLFGCKSWVGYCSFHKSEVHLPEIRGGVLHPANAMKLKDIDTETAIQLNILYARDYNIWKDLNIILYAFRDLGQSN